MSSSAMELYVEHTDNLKKATKVVIMATKELVMVEAVYRGEL